MHAGKYQTRKSNSIPEIKNVRRFAKNASVRILLIWCPKIKKKPLTATISSPYDKLCSVSAFPKILSSNGQKNFMVKTCVTNKASKKTHRNQSGCILFTILKKR